MESSTLMDFRDWLRMHAATGWDVDVALTARSLVECGCGRGDTTAEMRRCFRLALARWDGAAEIDILELLTAQFDEAATTWLRQRCAAGVN